MKFLAFVLLVVVVACGGQTDANDQSRLQEAQPASTSLSDPVVDQLITADQKTAWDSFIAGSKSEFPTSSLEIVGQSVIGIRAKSGDCSNFPSTPAEIQIFGWEVSAFVPLSTLEIDGYGEDSDWVQFIDLTNDGTEELVIQILCYESFAYVYSVGPQGVFKLAEASYLLDGMLMRYEQTCEPSCAEGGVNYYRLEWNGEEFTEVLTERELPNVAGSNFSGRDLSSFNMAGWDFTGADLNGANLRGANLAGANLTRVNLASADLAGANLSGATLTDADLYSANFPDANLEGADLRGAQMLYTNLSRANLLGANLAGVDLTNVELTGATMPDGSLFVAEPWSEDDYVD
jgi:Pentapeptide repeats (8 copies)